VSPAFEELSRNDRSIPRTFRGGYRPGTPRAAGSKDGAGQRDGILAEGQFGTWNGYVVQRGDGPDRSQENVIPRDSNQRPSLDVEGTKSVQPLASRSPA